MESLVTQQSDPLQEVVQTELEAVAEAINSGDCFLLVGHLRPDGDAIGSASGLSRSLRKAGKNVVVAFCDPAPARFAYLLEDEEVQKTRLLDRDFDAVIVLDTGDLPRTGFENELSDSRPLMINIDHHASNTGFGDLNFLDFEASSTCEMMVSLIRAAKLPFDPDVAEPLYLGMLTDSRFFQNDSIRPATFRAAETILLTGLDPAPLYARLNRTRTMQELRLLGIGLSKFQTNESKKVISLIVSKADLESCGATLEQVWSCGLFGQLVSVDGLVVAACFVEGLDGKCFCELRSNYGFNVKDIAVAMGGGGHLAASGCNRLSGMEEFSREVMDLVEKRVSSFVAEKKT